MRELPKVRIQTNVCSSTYILISPPDTFRDTPMHLQTRTQTYSQTLTKIHIHKQLSKLISNYHKNNDICGTIQLNRFRNGRKKQNPW